MNNKGQTLVIFVIIIPLLLLILSLVIDIGLFSIEKRKISNNTEDALEYYLKNVNDISVKEKTEKLLNENLEDIDILISDTESNIEITVKKEYKGLFRKFYDNNITIKYIGNKENNKIIKG